MDYRLKENRREAFIRWYAWSLEYKDCDPAVWLTNYINKRYDHNEEQKLWLCWLYGNTYYLPTSWILMNEFVVKKPFDPYPFILLNLVLSTIAALQAPIIMMSQNRKEEKDRQKEWQILL